MHQHTYWAHTYCITKLKHTLGMHQHTMLAANYFAYERQQQQQQEQQQLHYHHAQV